jgi:hypothetical protein
MSVRNHLLLPIIGFALAILASCGGNGTSAHVTPPPGGSFNNSNLKGTYIFSFSGTDTVNVGFFTIAGSFVADGNGGITSGAFDIADSATGATPGNVLTSGSAYSVSADGRGRGTLVTSGMTIGIDFVLTSNSHGMVIRFDNNGTGSGTLDLQDSTLTQSGLTSYAFSLSGVDSSANPFLTEGSFTLNGGSSISAGLQDFNDNNDSTNVTNLALTGSVSLGSAGPGTAQLSAAGSPFGSLTFDVWAIDATHLKLIETDGVEILEGDAFSLTTLPSGSQQFVYTMAGLDNSSPRGLFSAGGYVGYDGSSVIGPNGLEDINDSGTVGQSTTVNGTLVTSGAGRYQLTVSGFQNGINGGSGTYTFVGYPFSSGSTVGLLLMGIDGAAVTSGTAFVQTAQTFTSGQGYGFNLTGANQGGEVDEIAEFTANSGGALSNGVIDENDENNDTGESLAYQQALGAGGTYTYDSPATGRGVLSYPGTSTYTGTLNLAYYVVDGSNVVFVDGDNGQVGVGAFQAQSVPSASQAAFAHTQAHLSLLKAVTSAKARRRK